MARISHSLSLCPKITALEVDYLQAILGTSCLVIGRISMEVYIWMKILNLMVKELMMDRDISFILRNENGLKTAFINNEQYHSTRAGVNNWGKVIIGKPLWPAEEAGTGCVYEAICFDKALTDSQITKIYTKLIKYYPALPRTTNAVPEDLAWAEGSVGLSPLD